MKLLSFCCTSHQGLDPALTQSLKGHPYRLLGRHLALDRNVARNGQVPGISLTTRTQTLLHDVQFALTKPLPLSDGVPTFSLGFLFLFSLPPTDITTLNLPPVISCVVQTLVCVLSLAFKSIHSLQASAILQSFQVIFV